VALTARDLDRRGIVTAGAVILAVTLPPIWIVRLLKGGDVAGSESNLWVVAPLALLAGFAIGGHRAARRRPDMPLIHATAAGALAFAAVAAYTIVRHLVAGDDVTAAFFVRVALLGQIAVSVSLLGGYLAMRRSS